MLLFHRAIAPALQHRLPYSSDTAPWNATTASPRFRGIPRLRPLVFCVAGLALTVGAVHAQNLAVNPGFETGDTRGWSAFGAGSISTETSEVHSGSSAALVTGRTASWNGIAQSFLGVLEPGKSYTISAWLRLVSGPSQTVALTMLETDASGTSYTWAAVGTVTTNAWVQLSGNYTFNPTGTATALSLYAEVPSSGTAAYEIDDLDVQRVNPTSGHCQVDWTNVFQQIDGFGASSAWGSSWTTSQADMFFSTNSGTGTTVDGKSHFNFNGIGLSLLPSRIAPDGTTVESNIMRMAQERGARVWSPPAIYKSTNSVNGGSFVSSTDNFKGYANHLARYVAAMKADYGIHLYAVSVQNEPDLSTSYESCLWTAEQFHEFVPYLAAALTNAGVGSTRIVLPEDSNWNYDFGLADAVMKDSQTAAQVGLFAAHGYGAAISPLNSQGHRLWETEVSTFDAYDGSITNGLYWANKIHDYLTVAQVNAWHFWWLIPFPSDNESLVDTNGIPAKRMYTLGQFSRFVRPGYKRMGVENNSGISISAYKSPASGSFAIVAINTNQVAYTQTFNLTGFDALAVTPWITSASLSLAHQSDIPVTNATFVAQLPSASVVTFVGESIATTPPTVTAAVKGHDLVIAWPSDHTGWTLTMQTNGQSRGVIGRTNDWTRLSASRTTNQFIIPTDLLHSAGFFASCIPDNRSLRDRCTTGLRRVSVQGCCV